MKYPEIEVQLTGQSGNAFSIIGRVSSALKKSGVPLSDVDAFHKQAMSGDYDNVLRTAKEWVNVS